MNDPSMLRREFLVQSIAGGAACALTPTLSASGSEFARMRNLSPQHFEDLIGNRFSAHNSAGCCSMVLREVNVTKTQKSRPVEVRSQPFSLVFEIQGRAKLSNEIHQVYHSELGGLDLFLHNVDGVEDRFEVIFN